jgi:hypothetical protein
MILVFCLAWGVFSCSEPQKGSLSPETRTEMEVLATQNIDLREKYFALSIKIVAIMEEVAAIENDALAIEKVREFISDNGNSLAKVYDQFDNWQKHESDETLIAFITKYNEQPSARRLRQLVPALHNRFRYEPAYVAELEKLVDYISIKR